MKTAEQARAIAQAADGVVVGSALIDALKATLDAQRQGAGGFGRRRDQAGRKPRGRRALGQRSGGAR